MTRTLPAVLLALLPLSCAAPVPTEQPPPRVLLRGRPQSAYAALVRTLEVLDAVRTPQTAVLLRGVECDTLLDRRRGGEFVRVVLDLTVLAPDFPTAVALREDLVRALEAEGGSALRVEEVAPHRVERVFVDMDWTPPALAEPGVFEALVSISDAVRVEVRRPAPTGAFLEDGAGSSGAGFGPAFELEGSIGMDAYIVRAAAAGVPEVAPLATDVHVEHPVPGTADLRYRIRTVPAGRPLSREAIGRFLRELEAGSPGVRVTHVAIHRADAGLADRWTLEADVSVRVARDA